MKVLTINLWGRSGDWAARRSVLRQGLAELGADLIAFQESFVLPDYDQVRDLVEGYEVVHQERRAPDGGGISIASRLPLRSIEELDLHVAERPRDFAAGALLVEVATPEPLLFVNHFPSWQLDQEDERERHAVMVARKIAELGVERVVIAGDMDADPASSSIRFWTGRASLEGMSVCYRDAWEAKHHDEPGDTVNFGSHEDWPFRRIDYILVRCGLHGGPLLPILSCDRWLDQPVDGVWASDHFGVAADLRIA